MTFLPSLLAALALVESAGDPQAVNGRAAGCLQITPVVLRDVARIYGVRYAPAARYSPAASRQIASLYLSHYARTVGSDPATLAAVWRAGPRGYRRAHARAYAERVCNLMEAQR